MSAPIDSVAARAAPARTSHFALQLSWRGALAALAGASFVRALTRPKDYGSVAWGFETGASRAVKGAALGISAGVFLAVGASTVHLLRKRRREVDVSPLR